MLPAGSLSEIPGLREKNVAGVNPTPPPPPKGACQASDLKRHTRIHSSDRAFLVAASATNCLLRQSCGCLPPKWPSPALTRETPCWTPRDGPLRPRIRARRRRRGRGKKTWQGSIPRRGRFSRESGKSSVRLELRTNLLVEGQVSTLRSHNRPLYRVRHPDSHKPKSSASRFSCLRKTPAEKYRPDTHHPPPSTRNTAPREENGPSAIDDGPNRYCQSRKSRRGRRGTGFRLRGVQP